MTITGQSKAPVPAIDADRHTDSCAEPSGIAAPHRQDPRPRCVRRAATSSIDLRSGLGRGSAETDHGDSPVQVRAVRREWRIVAMVRA